MTYKCNQTGITISPAPVREFYSYADRSALPVGGSVTATDGSKYLLITVDPITDTINRILLAPISEGGPH